MSELCNNTISHLKQINFALLVFTTIVVVMSLLVQKNKLETALNDLGNLNSAFNYVTDTSIVNATSNIGNFPIELPKAQFDELWLKNEAKEILKNNSITFNEYSFKRDSKSKVKLNTENFVINSPSQPDSHWSMTESFGGFRPKGSTLADIKLFWDRLHSVERIIYIKSLQSKRLQYSEKNEVLKYIDINFDFSKEGFFTPSGNLLLIDINANKWIEREFKDKEKFPSLKEAAYRAISEGGNQYRYFVFGSESQINGFNFSQKAPTLKNVFANKILIPALTDELSFQPLDILIQQVPKKFDWKSGNFDLNFSELELLTKGYQDIPVSKIKLILQNELSRSSGSVNAFGLAIPYEILSRFGALAILVIQLYFLFYLRFFHTQFNEVHERDLTVPWIYLHKNIDALIVYFFVSIVYPASVALFFAWENIFLNISFINLLNITIFFAELVVTFLLTKIIVLNYCKNKTVQTINS